MQAAVGVLTLACIALYQGAQPPTRPRFDATADAVGIDVLVTDRRGAVRGLGTSDFQLFDNGIEQTIRVVSAGDVPLLLSLVIDTSESVSGPTLPQLRGAARELIGKLNPRDRVNVITVADAISLAAPATAAPNEAAEVLQHVAAAGGTRLFDAIWSGLQLFSEPSTDRRRMMMMIFSDGRDTTSWLDADAPRALLERGPAVVFAVTVPSPLRDTASASDWAHVARLPDHRFLESLTDASGGRLFVLRKESHLSSAFEEALADMRSRYALYYQPAGVARVGRHMVTVTVNRRGARVQARRSYVIP